MDYYDYLYANQGFFKVLMLQLGLKCPLVCRHCFTNSNPNRTECMDVELIRVALKQFGSISTSQIVMLAGGEPFVYRRKQLKVALEEIDRFPDLYAHVITSGYWASSLHCAIKVLQDLPPISLLSVSADVYHQEFIPFEYLRNVLLACEELGISGSLCVHLDSGDESYLERLKRAIGERLFGEYLRRVGQVIPEGRAAILGYPMYNEEQLPVIGCTLAGSPTVLHDGTVLMCCDGEVANRASDRPEWPYNFGCLPRKSLIKIYEEMNQDAITQGLRVLGPKRFLDMLDEANIRHPVHQSYYNICELCMTLMDEPCTVQDMRELLQTPINAGYLKFGRFLLYGESINGDPDFIR